MLILISSCKTTKLNRHTLVQFIAQHDPTLPTGAFYCVWRAYGGDVDIDRLKRESALHPLSCYLKLTKTADEFEKISSHLLSLLPEGSELPYMKV